MIRTIRMASRGTAKTEYSQGIDIYSFGIIMYEAIELNAPWWEEKYQKWTSIVFDAVEDGKKPIVSPARLRSAPEGYVELMNMCQSFEPKDRPDFLTITHRLRALRGDPIGKRGKEQNRTTNADQRKSSVIRHDSFFSVDSPVD